LKKGRSIPPDEQLILKGDWARAGQGVEADHDEQSSRRRATAGGGVVDS
jgi:hypothetical protein